MHKTEKSKIAFSKVNETAPIHLVWKPPIWNHPKLQKSERAQIIFPPRVIHKLEERAQFPLQRKSRPAFKCLGHSLRYPKLVRLLIATKKSERRLDDFFPSQLHFRWLPAHSCSEKAFRDCWLVRLRPSLGSLSKMRHTDSGVGVRSERPVKGGMNEYVGANGACIAAAAADVFKFA